MRHAYRRWRPVATLTVALALAGCATRSGDVRPDPTDPAQFGRWSCERIDDEIDGVQQRAADVAYALDELAGHNVLALGVGVAIFWPAILAMKPEGSEARELAQLKGRFEALTKARQQRGCRGTPNQLPDHRLAGMPVAAGERMVYEERSPPRGAIREWGLRLVTLRRDELEWRPDPGDATTRWQQDLAGNLARASDGSLIWPRLLRRDLALGQVIAGELLVAGDSLTRARVRGQVVALGPQWVGPRRFEAAVIELFGDAMRGDASTRLDGVIVIDRVSGVLLRLDLRSAFAPFALQRRLARIEPAPR